MRKIGLIIVYWFFLLPIIAQPANNSNAEFPGGKQGAEKYLTDNLIYPEEALLKRLQGQVRCRFVVNTEGDVTDVSVVKSGGNILFDDEAVRLVSSMPRWQPAVRNGEPVETQMLATINFRLPDDYFERILAIENSGDKLFKLGRYMEAEECYKRDIQSNKDTESNEKKLAVTTQCKALLLDIVNNLVSASSGNYECYYEACRLYKELFAIHGMPEYEQKANICQKKAKYYAATKCKNEGDELFKNEEYVAAASKYKTANGLMIEAVADSTFALQERSIAITCEKLLERARIEELDAIDDYDAVKYQAASRLYAVLYNYNSLKKYLDKSNELKKHTPMMGIENQPPRFLGGMDALFDYVRRQIDIPIPQGYFSEEVIVVCGFKVCEDGRVDDVEIVQPAEIDTLNSKSVEIVKSLPKWSAGKRNGKPAKYSYVIPITYRIPIEAMVDLGLPSGLKWSSMNLGARFPYDTGNYYQWGCIEPARAATWDDYCYGRQNVIYKYCTDSRLNAYDGLTVLQPEDDAATLIMGDGWRMPTREEAIELWKYCTREWETHGNICGYRFTGPNGKSIFLPATGYLDKNGQLRDNNVDGLYWTSTLYTRNNNGAYGLITRKGEGSVGVCWGPNNRQYARAIRPVHP